MPLIDLKTNLKSLKYGQDTPGGGDSGQPYNQFDINLSNQIVRKDDDSYIRGGAYGAAKASSLDTIRIRKFLGSNPKGTLFLTKQVGLQFSNPRIETKQVTLGNNTGFLGFASKVINAVSDNFGPTRIYNLGFNTLAQIPSTAYGQHFVRHGLLPVMDDEKKYEAVVKYNNENGSNRLLRLSNKFQLDDWDKKHGIFSASIINSKTQQLISRYTKTAREIGGFLTGLGSLVGGKFGKTVTKVGQGITKVANVVSLFNNNQDLIIDDYAGGPGSTYGIGKTIIRRYSITENGDKIAAALKKSKEVSRLTQINYNSVLSQNGPTVSIEDDGKTIVFSTGVENQNAVNYNSKSNSIKTYDKLNKSINQLSKYNNKPQQIPGIGYVENTNKTFKNIPESINDSSKIGLNRNAPDFKYNGGGKIVDKKTRDQIIYNNNQYFERIDSDILTIAFTIIDPFTLNEDRIYLSAYMSGFKDNFTGNWEEINYNGRSESFYIYNKGKRDVSFNLQIPCFNKKELFEKHRALGQLASTTAGTYSTSNNALGGVLIKLNVGRYLEGEYSILNSISYDIPDNATWDIDTDAKLAMTLNVSFNFTIIHKKLPQYKYKEGFFSYLPDTISGYIRKKGRSDEKQSNINASFIIDDSKVISNNKNIQDNREEKAKQAAAFQLDNVQRSILEDQRQRVFNETPDANIIIPGI